MSAFDMKPNFGDRAGYRAWLLAWRKLYRKVCRDIRAAKAESKRLSRENAANAGKKQRELVFTRAMGRKLMDLRVDAVARMERIDGMVAQIANQKATFPRVIENATVDFHYNRASNEFGDLPMWVVKAKGKTYYVDHVTANAPWSTHERPSATTRGMMRFRRCNLILRADNTAEIVTV